MNLYNKYQDHGDTNLTILIYMKQEQNKNKQTTTTTTRKPVACSSVDYRATK